MTKVLSDGSVISSNLSMGKIPSARDTYRADVAFKSGTVTAIYYPDDAQNMSKEFIEYDVQVTEARNDGSISTINYARCQVTDLWGSTNNFNHFTLQPATKNDDGFYENGSKVTVLALNGNSSSGKAVIVGGLPYAYTVNRADGQFYNWQFNGINQMINKDGEYILTFNTPIDVDGNKLNAAAAGTQIKIAKDGSLKISDNEGQFWLLDRVNKVSSWGNGNEIITIDKTNKQISMTSTGDIKETAKDSKSENITNDYNLATDSGSINQSSGKDIVQNANGNITQKAGSSMQMQSGANIQAQAGNSIIFQANQVAQLNGTTTILGVGGISAAGVGISQALGFVGAVPVLSTVITGSTSCFIGI